MEREQKRTEVAQLKGTFATAKSAVVLGFKGLTVDKDTSFRKSIRESKAQYRVSKNTLLRLAVKETVFEGLSEHFKGATAVATTENDVVGLAKAVNNFLKDNPGRQPQGRHPRRESGHPRRIQDHRRTALPRSPHRQAALPHAVPDLRPRGGAGSHPQAEGRRGLGPPSTQPRTHPII